MRGATPDCAGAGTLWRGSAAAFISEGVPIMVGTWPDAVGCGGGSSVFGRAEAGTSAGAAAELGSTCAVGAAGGMLLGRGGAAAKPATWVFIRLSRPDAIGCGTPSRGGFD
jgi:hypothetical protein